MSVIKITVIQFDRAIRENTVLTVIAHPIEIKIYLLIYLLTYLLTTTSLKEVTKTGNSWITLFSVNLGTKISG